MATILVTGGAGYIGSHTIIDLINTGHDVISIDNFINSRASIYSQIRDITGKAVKHYDIDLCCYEDLEKVFKENRLQAVIHFAALKSVGESVEKPLMYFRNNLVGLMNLLDLQEKYGVHNLIFSSSCSVYGNADQLPVTENTPLKKAESPYARTKQMGEEIIFDFLNAFPQFWAVILRYFNPAGAHESNLIGESPHNPPNNLVPIITETAIGKREKLWVFGGDYPTRDGTCIRDFIHIMDLADAHTRAADFLLSAKTNNSPVIINLGSGTGSSVLEAIDAFEKVSGKKLNYEITSRRPGDVIAVYADYGKAKNLLNWSPKYHLEDIMKTAWAWEKKRSGVVEG